MESIESLVSAGMKIMKSFSMSEKNLQIFYCSCFKPIVNKYASKGFIYYNEGLMSELERGFLKQYEDGIISRQTRNKRIRGLTIIRCCCNTLKTVCGPYLLCDGWLAGPHLGCTYNNSAYPRMFL